MLTDRHDFSIYVVENALRKMNRSKVTSTRNADHVLFVMDWRWELYVDEDDLDKLYEDAELPSTFETTFNKIAEKGGIRLRLGK